eukprot:EG_transcript_12143
MDGRRPANFFSEQHPSEQDADPSFNRSAPGGAGWPPTRWASVLDLADRLHVNVPLARPGDFERLRGVVDQLPLKQLRKVFLYFNHTGPRVEGGGPEHAAVPAAEAATLTALRDHCVAERVAGRKAFVLFLHMKGQPDEVLSPTRKDIANAFSLQFPSVCLRALLEGYAACGVNLQDGGQAPHYSDAGFWANCDHIAALPPVPVGDQWGGRAPEAWLFRVSHHFVPQALFAHECAYNAHTCQEEGYESPCRPAALRSAVLEYGRSRWLPPSGAARIARGAGWVREHCHPLFKQPYTKAPFWADPGAFTFMPAERTE